MFLEIIREFGGRFRVPQAVGVELVEETSDRTVRGAEHQHGGACATLGDVLSVQRIPLPLGAHSHLATDRVEQPYRVAFMSLGAAAVVLCDLSPLHPQRRPAR